MNLQEHILQELSAWSERPEGQRVEEFLAERLSAHEARELLSAIDEGEERFRVLRAAREEEGVNRAAWLGRQLKPLLTRDPHTERLSLEVGEGVTLTADRPAELAHQLTEGLTTMLWGEPERVESSKEPLNTETLSTEPLNTETLSSSPYLAPLSEVSERLIDSAPKPVQEVLRGYFESPLSSPQEREVVGVISGATRRATQALPLAEQPPLETLGSVVDHGMFGAKVAVLVGAGQLNATTAKELIEDRAAVHIARAAGRIVDKGLMMVGGGVGAFLGGLIGQAPLGAKIGAFAGKLAGKAVRPLIEEGAKAVVKTVSKVASSVVKGVGSALKSVGRGVMSFFGW